MAKLIMEEVFYRYPGTKRDILNGVNAEFPEGKVTAIMGRSGAGKSTTLYLLAGLDVPYKGKILYNGEELTRSMLDSYRRNETATIAQNYLLFPTRTVLENVLYPLELSKTPKEKALRKAKAFLDAVDIPEELHGRLPSNLSGGEQQRVAVAASEISDKATFTAVRYRVMDTSKELNNIIGELEEVGEIPAEFINWVNEFSKLQNDINAANNAANALSGGSYTWDQFRDVLDYVMNIDGVYINGDSFADFDKNNAGDLLGGGVVELTLGSGSGVLADIADFVGNFNVALSVGVNVDIISD